MNADDLHDLYKLVRGNRAATAVTDAQTLYMEKKMIEAYEKLCYAKETFVESRSRVIKQDVAQQVDPKAKDADKQIKKLKRKQDKVLEAVKKFDEVLPVLEKLAKREEEKLARRPSSVDSSESKSDGSEVITSSTSREQIETVDETNVDHVARPSDITQQFAQAFNDANGDDQFTVIGSTFDFQEVREETEIIADAIYYIRSSNGTYLVRTLEQVQAQETVSLASVVDDRPIKPFTRTAFLKMGADRKMVLLTKKAPSKVSAVGSSESSSADRSDVEPGLSDPLQEDSDEEVASTSGIDMAAFSQLLSAAQRSGIVPGADLIGHVRDREFRMGNYDLAFQSIDSLFSRFGASAAQRAQRLRQEDTDIASGRIKISAKDLLAKRNQDRMQTREIDRTQRRFQVVLEGIRVLMNGQRKKGAEEPE